MRQILPVRHEFLIFAAMEKVLFVCLGNICRSPAAEEVARQIALERGLDSEFEFDSASTYGGHAGQLPDNRMRVNARRRGYELSHRARRISTSDFFDFDLIVTMDDANFDDVREMAPSPETEAKVVKMADYATRHCGIDCIPDPYYDGAEGFENVLDLLEDACEGLIDSLGLKNRN